MIIAIKIILTLAIILLLSYPFIPMKGKMRKFSVASSLKYNNPHNRKNVFFVLLSVVEFIVLVLLFKLFEGLSKFIYSIPFIGRLLSNAVGSINSQVDYVLFAIQIVLVNLILVYVFVILKAFLRKALINPIFHIGNRKERFRFSSLFKRKKNGGKADNENDTNGAENQADSDEEKLRKRRRIPNFVHSLVEDDGVNDDENGTTEENKEKKREYGKFASMFLSIFFEGEQFEYAKNWVVRSRTILQFFIRIIQVVYILFFTTVLLSVFFKLPMPIYSFLTNIIRIRTWYVYPVISMIFLQEICNIFDTDEKEEKTPEKEREEEEKKEDRKREARLRALLAELKKRFDSEHSLRYYPEISPQEVPEYKSTNVMYASALNYIRNRMEESSGRVVQSYMECLDAVYRDTNVYFSASFYSEFGEYLIAYTYTRLLSGARQIFIVSDSEEKDTLRRFISDRLMRMTGSNAAAGWRVYTADERLDQADVLIASPEDFVNVDIVEQYPSFFEEACNAVFIDADRSIALSSYICPIIATKLQNATGGRIRFVFLTLDLLKGFAAGSLPRFFCVDKVLSFSSAGESEAVSYVLWNKESKKHRIYNKGGQKLTALETIIAEQACLYGIDGVRLITQAPLEPAEHKVLSLHNVEINNLYKNVVDVNYMIYSDDRCNLSAALYACTRFRGRKKSVVHILSKPYLLREYFMSKATIEDYINRSSFIQPRVTEHAERFKLSLLRIFSDASFDKGLPVAEFERRMRDVITAAKERNDIISSAYCRRITETRNIAGLKLSELAAYLIAGLCDNDVFNTLDEERICASNSLAYRAKDFYIVVEPSRYGGYSLVKEKYILFNRVKEVFERLLECNRRVELRLNDRTLGRLDTFPSRVHLEYIEGQSIIFNNSEYEIERIATDGSAVYLRQENISIKNCLDTVLLRSYKISSLEAAEKSAVLNNSQSMLEEIRVTKCRAALEATTYGFYSITTDRQTLDFYRGVEGNPHSEHPNVRNYANAGALKVSLKVRRECNDGMRLLMSAVFNEFIRTIFPSAYRCVAICPILENPFSLEALQENDTPLERIRTLYPFLNEPAEDYVETDSRRMQFLFINDCREDVGVLDWFYDRSARYMQEFLANIYSYLHWLKIRPEKNHYIYFGGDSLPECYDLEGCCEMLSDFNLVLSDDGKKDIETAGDDTLSDKVEYCSFCHKPMESGRYSFFDKHRYICANCFDTVDEEDRLNELYISVKEYLVKQYPEIIFGAAKIKFDAVYDLTLEQILSEFYSRVDFTERTIFVEQDNPIVNVCVSLLRGIISFWQADNSLSNQYSSAQLYYEEICYLRSIGENVSADWVYGEVPEDVKAGIDEIMAYINPPAAPEENTEDEEVSEDNSEENSEDSSEDTEEEKKTSDFDNIRRTSFSFMRMKGKELIDDDEVEDPIDDEYSDDLYDPNKIPRFWKRYLRGEHLDDGKEDEIPSDADAEDDDEESEDEEDAEEMEKDTPIPNAPFDDDSEVVTSDTGEKEKDSTSSDDDAKRKKEEKQRQKEEKKRQREEKRRQKQLEWERNLDKLDEEEKKKKSKHSSSEKEEPAKEDDTSEKKKEKKFSLFGKKKKKNEEEDNNKDDGTSEDLKDDNNGTANDEDIDDTDKLSNADDSDTGDTSDGSDGTDSDDNSKDDDKKSAKTEKKKKDKQKSKKKSIKNLFDKQNPGEKILPRDEEEEKNPKIKLYNEIVRAAYNYSEEAISREGISDADLQSIYIYVKGDYPELFWVQTYSYTPTHMFLKFRFKDANGRFDVKQVNKKRQEMKKGAAYFTKGINKKTDPYEALLKIYRKVILTLDYDMVGLNARVDLDESKDDALRSLYNALVNHKVVCAGYAVAMQYLLQSVGIVCGYVISETAPDGICHAFNILKIGKYCYYLDATWGDSSTTDSADNKNSISYDYFCVPFDEFIKTPAGQEAMHHPRRSFYPDLEKFRYVNHEYYRYHNAYLKSYNENELIRIFADTALKYDEKEMGDFSVSFRCASSDLMSYVFDMLHSKGKIYTVLDKAKAEISKKDKKAAKLLEGTYLLYSSKTTGVMKFVFENASKGKDKKKKK